MSTLSLFDEPNNGEGTVPEPLKPMYDSQRAEIRSQFTQLGLATARSQFELVEELIGIRLKSVTELTAADAQQLILRLRGRVSLLSRSSTGNSWADRDEDTWIDKL